MNIALYQPDIPQNVGAAMRLCACMDIGLDIIEPCGFAWNEKRIRASAMDYFDGVNINKHTSWNSFFDLYQLQNRRIILMSTKSSVPYTDFEFKNDDILLAGRESAGVPEEIHQSVHGRIYIPMYKGFRSLNVVNATSMILGEALRQTR